MTARSWLLDIDRNVRNILRRSNGGTGNLYGWSSAVVQPFPNGEGGTLAIGTVVRMRAGIDEDRRVSSTSGANSTQVVGVVVGTFTDLEGTYTATDPTEFDMVAVMTAGVCDVVLGSAVTRGHYAYTDATAGTAKSSSTVGAGAFGRFLESAASGSAKCFIGMFGGFGSGGAGAAVLDDLDDVTITSPAADDVLRYDGSEWVNDDRIWRPVMDGYGNVVVDSGSGEAIMGLGPQ